MSASATSLRRFLYVLRIAARNFPRFRLQAVVIFVATVTGTTGVIVATGYAAGGRQKVLDQFSRLGTNVLTVVPLPSRATGGRARTGSLVTTLTLGDWISIQRAIPAIKASSPMVGTVLRLRAGDLTKSTPVIGCRSEFFEIKSWPAVHGRVFDERLDGPDARLVLLGTTVAQDLFGASDPTGEAVSINRVPFKVVGVLKERGQGLDASNQDDQVYVPLETAMHRLMNVTFSNSITFEVDAWSHMDSASREITSTLTDRHRRFLSKEVDFQVQNQKTLLETQLSSFARLTFLVRWIAASTLAVSSLGVFALTWIGVRHRTHEIGTRRAIGATRADILIQFFAEGMMGACLGCGSGLVASYLLLRAVDIRLSQPFVFTKVAALEEVLLAVALNAGFILVSALRAVRVEPSVALRSE